METITEISNGIITDIGKHKRKKYNNKIQYTKERDYFTGIY
jgi:hypothetical protein